MLPGVYDVGGVIVVLGACVVGGVIVVPCPNDVCVV